MNKYISPFFFLLLITFCSCQQKSSVEKPKQAKSEKPSELQKMRSDANSKYNEAKDALQKVEAPTQKMDASIPCNINYLASIKNSKKLSNGDFNRLLTMNTKECSNNVEFQQFYNQVLLTSIERNPTAFYQNYINPKLRIDKRMIADQLNNPISDAFDTKKILSKVSREAQINLKLKEFNPEYQRLLKNVTN